jgi:hypothetical protein
VPPDRWPARWISQFSHYHGRTQQISVAISERTTTNAANLARDHSMKSTPSVPKCLSLENRISLTDTLFGRLTLRDGVVVRTVGHASVARSTSWWLPLWQLLKWVTDRCELYCCSLIYVRAFRTMDRSWRVRVQSNVTKTGTCICMRPWMENSTVCHGSNALTTFLYLL